MGSGGTYRSIRSGRGPAVWLGSAAFLSCGGDAAATACREGSATNGRKRGVGGNGWGSSGASFVGPRIGRGPSDRVSSRADNSREAYAGRVLQGSPFGLSGLLLRKKRTLKSLLFFLDE
jgi:hypothetical protein